MNTETLLSFLPLVFVLVVFYFLIIRPQNKQQKEIQKMRDGLKKGDKIMTIGGFIAKIVSLKENVVTIELKPDNVKVQISKSAISEVLNGENEKED